MFILKQAWLRGGKSITSIRSSHLEANDISVWALVPAEPKTPFKKVNLTAVRPCSTRNDFPPSLPGMFLHQLLRFWEALTALQVVISPQGVTFFQEWALKSKCAFSEGSPGSLWCCPEVLRSRRWLDFPKDLCQVPSLLLQGVRAAPSILQYHGFRDLSG